MKSLLLLTLASAILVLSIESEVRAQTGTLELFSDASATSCALVQSTGLMSIFVFQTAGEPSTAIGWFSAPKPACWNASWVADNWLPNAAKSGGSQTQISVLFGVCRTMPAYVLEILFLPAGPTPPCCQYVITLTTEYVRCDFAAPPIVIGPRSVTINPNASCQCSGPLAVESSTWGRVKSLYH